MEKAIKLRMIFMGTASFAKEMLAALIKEQYNIVAVFTRLDAPRGRKQEITKSPVRELAEENKIPVFQPSKMDEEAVSQVKKLKPDVMVVAAYGKILPREILEAPGFGCLNVHASLLPKYRGPSPVQNALLSGEKETGVTIIMMNEGIDTGDIIAQKKIAIDENDNAETLSAKLSRLGVNLLLETIPLLIERKIEIKKQDDSKATVCQLIEREDGRIIWEEEAETIFSRFRAFYPWPGIFCFWENDKSLERIKLTKISLQKKDPETKYRIGEVFELEDKIGVQAGSGVIIVEELQIEGKKSMGIRDFLNGYPGFIGSALR